MTEIVVGVVAVVLALVGGAAGWIRIDKHGAERERRKQAEKERNDAQAREAASRVPPASPSEASEILRRRLDRMRRRARDQ